MASTARADESHEDSEIAIFSLFFSSLSLSVAFNLVFRNVDCVNNSAGEATEIWRSWHWFSRLR